jgi:hypothetical protein
MWRSQVPMDDKFSQLLKRLEAVTTKLETMDKAPAAPLGGSGSGAAAATPVEDEALSPMVLAFDAFLAGPIAEYCNTGNALGQADVCPPPACQPARTAGLAPSERDRQHS